MSRINNKYLLTYVLAEKSCVDVRLVSRMFVIDMHKIRLLETDDMYGCVWFKLREFMGLIPHGRHVVFEGQFYRHDNEVVDKIYIRGKLVYQNDRDCIKIANIKMRRKENTNQYAWRLVYRPSLSVVYYVDTGYIGGKHYLIISYGFLKHEIYRREVRHSDDRRRWLVIMMKLIYEVEKALIVLQKASISNCPSSADC